MHLATFAVGVLLLALLAAWIGPRASALTAELSGRVMVRDVEQGGVPSFYSDRLIVDLAGAAPPPSDSSLYGYLLDENGEGFYSGELPVVDGAIEKTVDLSGWNLLSDSERFQIVQQKTLLDISLPPVALTKLRVVTSLATDTPDTKGYGVGLAEQAALLHTHALLAKQSMNDGNLFMAKTHVEHVLNILAGQGNPNYGDHNGNGTIENPGDDYGVLVYAQKTAETMAQVAAASDATQNMVDRAAEAQTSIANFWSANSSDQTWSTLLVDKAQAILAATSADAAAKTAAAQLADFANRIANGIDAVNDNGTVDPIDGEGGALTAFRSAQAAADYLPAQGNGISGAVTVRSSGQSPMNDHVAISFQGVTAPATGNDLWAYLANDDGIHAVLGQLSVNGDQATLAQTVTWTDLIARYSRFYLTEGALYADDDLPQGALTKLRVVTSLATDTPDTKGYGVGLAEQAALLHTHALLAKQSMNDGNLFMAKTHVEHVLNILAGQGNPNYGDHNGNGTIENPGDDYGVLVYAQKTAETMAQVAAASDATQNMVDRAAEAQTSIANFWSANSSDQTWSTLLVDKAQAILAATSADTNAKTLAAQLADFANRIANGIDAVNDNGTVDPIDGEGGALTAFRSAQAAADYFPQSRLSAPTPTPTTTAGATATPTATTPVPEGGDTFEDDDVCAQAKTIAANGSTQSHDFHDEGDTDWLRFTAQANKTYIIEVQNVGTKADAVVFLYDICTQDAADSGDNAFGSTVRLEWDSTKNGDYFVKLQQFDPSFHGDDTNYQVSVSVDNVPPSAPTNPRCISISATTLGVQWKRSPERDVTRYRVKFSNMSGTFAGSDDVFGGDTTYYQLSDLTPNETYKLRMRALDYSNNESPLSGEVQCVARAPEDSTQPALTIQQPSASTIYTTTASQVTVSGQATDGGDNLSRVRVKNVTQNMEGWDYTLAGGSDDFRVEDLALGVGDNSVQVTAYDAAGNSSQKNVVIRRLGKSPGAVIIVAGHNETFGLQTNIYNSTNRAYRIFRSAGFTDDDIYYLSPAAQDANKDGTADEVDASSTPANFQNAIVDWAKDKVGANKPLFIYMMDHGFEDKFCVNGCNPNNSISSEDLDGWLRTLEQQSGVTEVNVIYEACVSGSFINGKNGGVTDSISKEGRVIITSTGADNNAYASAQGAYFSDAFFSCIADSGSLKACFEQAKAAVSTTGVNQTPFLDDNGDRVYNANDGTIAQNRSVTHFFSSLRPAITSANVTKQGTDGTLTATVAEGAEAIDLVWAAVYPPSFQEPGDVTINLKVPVVRLEPVADQKDTFSVNYPNGFTEEGDYRIVFYAQDRLGINAQPVRAGEAESIFLPFVAN